MALLLSACMKDELPVPAVPRGDGMNLQACMGAGYDDQLWMDLRTGTVLSTNSKSAWDLAFESAPEGWHIYLNGARLMTAWNIGPVDIAQAHDTVGMAASRRIDAPNGHADSTAIGDWRGHNDVYVIDLGFTALGQALGTRKFRFTSVTATDLSFDVAELDGSLVQSITLPKDPSRAFTSFKLGTGVVPIEPAQGTWDLVFTQYTYQFYEPFLPYIVTGVLSANTTRIALVTGIPFDQVSLNDSLVHPFSTDRDVIGYDWKTYSFETASYTVDESLVYLIHDAEGYFYKLRFLDFYSDQGQVGCPQFVVEPL